MGDGRTHAVTHQERWREDMLRAGSRLWIRRMGRRGRRRRRFALLLCLRRMGVCEDREGGGKEFSRGVYII